MNSFNPLLITFLEIPIVNATAAAAVEFKMLWIPRRGILILLITVFFFPGKLIAKSYSENSFACLIFLIRNCDFEFVPYV